jgi:hypothetical protein
MNEHGAELPSPDPDRLPAWWMEDPDMWVGLTISMSEYLALERLEEE